MLRKFRRSYVVVAIIAAAVVLGLAGRWWTQPGRVVEAAFRQVREATSYHYTADLTLENDQNTKAILGEAGKIQIHFSGVFVRFKDNKKPRLQSAIAATIQTESVSLQLTGEARFVDDKAYLLITKAPPVFPGLVKLRGTWLELPRGGTVSGTNGPINSQLFTDVKAVGREKLDTITTTKYHAVAAQAAIIQFMDGIAELLGTSLTEAQITQLRHSMTQVKIVPVDVWISPGTRTVHQFQATIAVPGGNTMHLTLKLSDRNQPVNISAPENAQALH